MVLKKVNKIFKVAHKGQNIFAKANTINLAQFLVCQVWCSNALSLVHQRGNASSTVDGNFPYWSRACAMASYIHHLPDTHAKFTGDNLD